MKDIVIPCEFQKILTIPREQTLPRENISSGYPGFGQKYIPYHGYKWLCNVSSYPILNFKTEKITQMFNPCTRRTACAIQLTHDNSVGPHGGAGITVDSCHVTCIVNWRLEG